jgi:phospholipase/lecithinase/hemolysin
MKMFRKVMPVLVACALVAAPMSAARAAASPYSGLVAFGDSLSDTGNFSSRISALTFGLVTFPDVPYGYAPGRFSNGPVAVEYLAQSLGLGLTNYAVGGAKTGPSVIPGVSDNYIDESGGSAILGLAGAPFNGTGVTTQVASHIAASGGSAVAGDALYFIWAGPNDYFSLADRFSVTPPADVEALTSAYIGNAITHLQGSVTSLYMAGARSFLIPNMANLGVTPYAVAAGATFAAAATQVAALHNFYLDGLLDGLEASLAGAQFFTSDVFALTTQGSLDPASLGFGNSAEECQFNPACTDPSQFVYWDDVHITTAAHRAVAGQFASALAPVPEAQTWVMLLAGLGVLVIGRRLRA